MHRKSFILLIAMLVFAGAGTTLLAQTIDGTRCPGVLPENWLTDEWGEPLFMDPSDEASSADILNVWGNFDDGSAIKIAFNRAGTGAASFSWFFNTDCDTATGDTLNGGAEWAAFFVILGNGNISSNTLWEWVSGTFVNRNVGFSPFIGSYTCTDGVPDTGTDGLFMEMEILTGDIYSCNTSCMSISFVGGSTNAGGSPNSSSKDKVNVADVTLPFYINTPPTADAGPDQTVCLNSSVDFDGSASDDPDLPPPPDGTDDVLTYEWDIDYDGTNFDIDHTGVTPSHTYSVIGLYTVALIVTDSWGCADTSETTITVANPSDYNCIITMDPACAGELRPTGNTASVIDAGVGAHYAWTISDDIGTPIGEITNGQDTPSITFDVPADLSLSITIEVTVTDAIGCEYTCSNSDCSLPVELTSFSATAMLTGIQLDWRTESETENLGFLIERKTDGTDWTEIASFKTVESMLGQGTINSATDYKYMDALVQIGETYDYRLADVDYYSVVTYHATRTASVNQAPLAKVEEFTVLPAYPNPFNPSTTIRYGIDSDSRVSIDIYDISGKLVSRLIEENQTQGWHSIVWNGTNDSGDTVPAGIYFSMISTGNKIKTNKLMLLK